MATREEALTQLAKAQSAQRCTHLKLDGEMCGSPAMVSSDYCYHHIHFLEPPEPLYLPPLDDAESLQVIIHGILRALRDKEIDPRTAAQMLWGVQIAAGNLLNTKTTVDDKADRQLTTLKTRSELRREHDLELIKARAKAHFQTSRSLADHRAELVVKAAKEKAEAERDPAEEEAYEALMKRLEELAE